MRRCLLVLLIITLAITLAACGDDEKPAPPTATFTALPPTLPPTTPTPTPLAVPEENTDPLSRALIRVVQASPELPPVNIYLGGADIGRGFTPGMYHTTPLSFAAGTYVLRVVPAGQNPDEGTPMLSRQIELLAGQSVVAVITGPANALELVQSQEALATLGAGISRLSVIHAVPRGDVFNLQETNRNVLREVDYGVTGGPVEIAEGKHDFTFASGTETLAALNIDLIEKNAYTVVLYGSVGNYQTLNFRSRVNDETQVRVIHASPDLPAVDVYLGDTRLGENVTYRSAGEWAGFPSLPYQLRLMPAGVTEGDPIIQQQVTLSPDQNLSLVLFGPASQLRIEDVAEDLRPTAADRARLTFMLAAVGVESTMINNIGGELPGLDPVRYGSSEQIPDYPASMTGFIFRAGDNSRDIDRINEREWLAGSAYLVVITGYPDTEAAVFATEVGTTDGSQAVESATGGPLFELRLMNMLPDQSPVSLIVDNQPVFDEVVGGAGTDYHLFTPKPQHFLISAFDTGAPIIEETISFPDTTLPSRYTLFVYRDQGDARYVLASDSDFLLGDGQARLRVFHVVTGKGALQILRKIPELQFNEDSAPAVPNPEEPPTATPVPFAALIDRVEYGRPIEPQVILAQTYTLRIQESDTGEVLLDIPDVVFDELTTYDLLLLPDASGLGINPVLIALPK